VVAAGRLWDEAKNADVVVRAAPAIGGQVVLIGAGGAPVPARAGDDDPTAIDGHGVVATGELDGPQVAAWMSRAAVFVEPARYEPFGLAALEAALGGCALVLGDIPSLREVWGDAATYVSPDDPQALAHAVNALLDDPDRRARAARRAGQRARRYSAEAMGQRYIGLYAQLARLPMVAA
jgi:glycosyltransferase involved in cell wall biosynthesis